MAKPEAHPFLDLFGDAVQTRPMFGGFGLYAGGKIVGIMVRERIYLKTDEESRKAFLAENCKPFTYQKKTGKGISLRYYAIPERLYDEPEEFAQWIRKAEAVSAEPKKKLTKASRAAPGPGNKRRRA